MIDPIKLDRLISEETRSFVDGMLDFGSSDLESPQGFDSGDFESDPFYTPLTSPERLMSSHAVTPIPLELDSKINSSGANSIPSIFPALVSLVSQMLDELQSNLPRLLSLNPSRRDAIAHHLEQLAGMAPVAQNPLSKTDPHLPPLGGLRRWIESPLSPIQKAALRTYLEEVSLIALGQTLLLKNWSDTGSRAWTSSDLGRLNWALSTSLKPHLPLDREGWQITRPNLYSWYNPGPHLQNEIWAILESWRMEEEGPGLLLHLLTSLRQSPIEGSEARGYDNRFYHYLWETIQTLGLLPPHEQGAFKRDRMVFSPTLRDGSVARTGPTGFQWIGLESSAFQLMMAELMHLWWKPCAPPLWALGMGLEVHPRDQLALTAYSAKPSLWNRIAEMEAFDLSFVFEEQVIRAQGRSIAVHQFKERLESLPYFKKLRSPGSSLGDLQACVAMSKLRPHGILWWAREEPLSPKDGNEVLHFLLDKARLVAEWNFSAIEHALPTTLPLFPKYLYLFQRENHLESRHSHRPMQHVIQGQLRSHIELPLLLGDSFAAQAQPVQPRGQWSIHSHLSPTAQRDWLEKWPNPTSQILVQKLEQLRISSMPLAHFTTIRPTPDHGNSKGAGWSTHLALKGCWLAAENQSEGRKLQARPLPEPGKTCQGSGFLVLVEDESWATPLQTYLMSDWVHQWLDSHAERRGERWILNEQVIKWIPVPKILLHALGVPAVPGNLSENTPKPDTPLHWKKTLQEIPYQPNTVKAELDLLSEQNPLTPWIHAEVYIQTAIALDRLYSSQQRLFSLVRSDGQICWKELLEILPTEDCISVSVHPQIRLSGTLPPHLPIGKVDRVKAPHPGLLLATESGFTLHISSENHFLLHMIWEQLEGLAHPTWNELLKYLRVPRRIELAEATAMDVLRSHSEQSLRVQELKNLLNSCRLF